MLTKSDVDMLLDAMEERFVTAKRHQKDHNKLFNLLDGVAKMVRDIRDELGLTQFRVKKLESFRQSTIV